MNQVMFVREKRHDHGDDEQEMVEDDVRHIPQKKLLSYAKWENRTSYLTIT